MASDIEMKTKEKYITRILMLDAQIANLGSDVHKLRVEGAEKFFPQHKKGSRIVFRYLGGQKYGIIECVELGWNPYQLKIIVKSTNKDFSKIARPSNHFATITNKDVIEIKGTQK